MEKILIKLYVPVLYEFFDLLVPGDLIIEELMKVLISSVTGLSNGKYASSGKELLSIRSMQMLLNPKKTFNDYQITDGTEIMLL